MLQPLLFTHALYVKMKCSKYIFLESITKRYDVFSLFIELIEERESI